MDFFGEQDRARKQSRVLLGVFAVVLIGFATLNYVVLSFIGKMAGFFESTWALNPAALIATAALCCVVLVGCWMRYQDVRGGGRMLAIRFGGTEVNSESRERSDKRYLRVVAEMAVAASIPVPATYVLRKESAINAFVVGSGDDMALVVSQGAIDQLDRDELLAVVGHEFGHLANGDLAYNMRLLIVLGGLNSLDELGKQITGYTDRRGISHPGSSRHDSSDIVALVVVILIGVLLRIMGGIGVLGGNIVKASFSRQREYLADASSVQFTRNTYSLASALQQTQTARCNVALNSTYKEELAHLCFQMPGSVFGRIFDTHPPLEKRIDAIDKHFSVKSRQRKAREERKATAASNGAGGTPSIANTLSESLVKTATDNISCQAILFALFIGSNASREKSNLEALRFSYDDEFSTRVKNIRKSFGEELDKNKLRIIDYVMPSLSESNKDTRQKLLSQIEQMVETDTKSLENFAALKIIQRKLVEKSASADTTGEAVSLDSQAAKPLSISELGEELALLLSLMVEASGYSGERVTDEYTRVLRCYTNEHYPIRSANDEGVMDDMSKAFHELHQQPLVQRKAFVQHCSEIMELDGISMAEEVALINLFAASLDVPELSVA